MLRSKFTKTRDQFKAQKIFTDRVEPRTVFNESIQRLGNTPQEIIVYYGKGGIGKSRLLNRIVEESAETYSTLKQYTFHNIFISLDAYDYSNPVNILMAIRNEIHWDCGLFDYALLQYCSKAKMTAEEVISKHNLLSSTMVDVLNEIINIGTSSIGIPAKTLSKCVSIIKDIRLRNRYKEEIAELANLNEFEIFERLPYYLGLCISYAAEHGHIHVLFLDSYESLLIRTKSGIPSVDREEWLRELFLSSNVFRIVVASRDRFLWTDKDSEWAEYLNQHLVKNLSEEDSVWFLSHVPITNQSIVTAITKNAGGVPLYLDMCVDLYADSINSTGNFDIAILQKGEKIIDRYMRHLPDKDIYAIKVLSVPKCFSENFAIELLKRENYAYGIDELRVLLGRSVILPVEKKRGVWKVDESIRLHILAQMDIDRKRSIIENILNYVTLSSSGRDYPYLSHILNMVCEEPDCLAHIQEKCIQATECYANMGFWNEIHKILGNELSSTNDNLRALCVFAELIYLRRTGQLQHAAELAKQYPVKQEHLGCWFYMYRFLKIQIKHLLGYYDESIQNYKTLAEEMNLIRNVIPNHIYNTVCMKYADLLFLKGLFDASLEIVESLLQSKSISSEDQIELFRIKAHIYRFRMQYNAAQIIYDYALQIAEEHDLKSYMGKLYTNMTEVTCEIAPRQALEWFEKAKEENEKSANDIELGKALAAAAAAHATLGDSVRSIDMAKQSIMLAEKTGYKSGRAFGLAALYYSYSRAGMKSDAAQVKEQFTDQINKIGVYKYLLERLK